MEVTTIKKTTKELELEIIGENETILNPITMVLLENEDVEYAACIAEHPLSNKRRLFIRVKKGNPEEILKKVVKQLENDVKQFEKSIEDKVSTRKK